MFHMLCNALVGQDIHLWERKCLINERFTKQQDNSQKLEKRMKRMKMEIAAKLKDFHEELKAENVRNKQEMNARLSDGIKDV